jgi:hypothetical protein
MRHKGKSLSEEAAANTQDTDDYEIFWLLRTKKP